MAGIWHVGCRAAGNGLDHAADDVWGNQFGVAAQNEESGRGNAAQCRPKVIGIVADVVAVPAVVGRVSTPNCHLGRRGWLESMNRVPLRVCGAGSFL